MGHGRQDLVFEKRIPGVGGHNLVAHNASFDRRFLDAELERISMDYPGKFSCSMLAARRIFQQAPDHKLGTLIDYMNIPVEGVFHRALYDSEMTAKLWLAMQDDIRARYALSEIDFKLMQRLATGSRARGCWAWPDDRQR